jgi:hypothetical protein
MARVLSEQEVEDQLRSLKGLEIALPWKGYGSAVFLELGRLSPPQSGREQHARGEACVMMWDWRVENDSAVLFGSSNTGPRIETGIRGLQGSHITGISVTGKVPEVVGYFSNGMCLRSFSAVSGNPQWSIKLPSGSWLSAKDGAFQLDAEPEGCSEDETAEEDLSRVTAIRWGVPKADPAKGVCRACASFRSLDANCYLLDYGVCIAANSPFDGRTVHLRSGCPAFSASKLCSSE